MMKNNMADYGTRKANRTEALSLPAAGEKTPTTLYNETIKNKFVIDGITYCVLPFVLITFDDSYQRNKSADKAKINELARNWDDNLMDLPLVSEHPEEGLFYGIDCYHRIEALKINGRTSVLCKIATGLSEIPTERSVQEADLFSKQGPCENLTVGQKHKANVKRGIRQNVVLEECIQGRKLFVDAKYYRNMPADEKAKYADWRVLSGYTAALHIAGLSNGKELLNSVLDIIEAVNWRNAAGGYKSLIIKTIGTILNLHENSKYTKDAMIEYFGPMEPEEFLARAYAKYPNRKEKERVDILLEEEVSKRTGFPPMYTGGSLAGGIATQRAIKKAREGKKNAEKGA